MNEVAFVTGPADQVLAVTAALGWGPASSAGRLMADNGSNAEPQFSRTQRAKALIEIYEKGKYKTGAFSKMFVAVNAAQISQGVAKSSIDYAVYDVTWWRNLQEHSPCCRYDQLIRFNNIDWDIYDHGGPPEAPVGNFLQDVFGD